MTLKTAKNYFYNKDYKSALNLFLKEEEYYSCGLCSLLLGDMKSALNYWSNTKKDFFSCSWGICLIGMINSKVVRYPSFFQIRAFLEVYINLLIENNHIDWAQNLINCCDDLYKCNPEAYKFIGRALFANGYLKLAIKFCKKNLKIFSNDPEAFLILSQCYFLLGDLGESLDFINRLLAVADDYYPAKLFRKVITDEIKRA